MTDDNLIIIEGGAFTDIKKAVRQWIDLYSDSIDKDCSVLLYKNGFGKHIVKTDDKIDDESYCYLLNYLKYPENLTYNVKIFGYLTVTDSMIFPDIEIGSKIQVFIPDFDTDCDNVYAVTNDNETYKFDFGGNTEKVERVIEYKSYGIDLNNLSDPVTLKVRQKNIKKDKPNAKKIAKRFNIISVIIVVLYGFSYLSVKMSHNFSFLNFFLGYSIFFWFLIDYKMFQLKEFYFKSLLIGLMTGLYGYLLYNDLDSSGRKMIILSTLMPIFFLVFQPIYRYIFKTLMKREPVIKRPAPSFADGFYAVVLFITVFILSIIFVDE